MKELLAPVVLVLAAPAYFLAYQVNRSAGPALEAAPRTVGPIQFEDRQRESGISFVLDNGTTPDKPVIDAVLGGVALLDFDDDGRLDVFFTNGARIPGLAKDDPRFWNRLYRNEGAGRFRDVTEEAGVRGEGYSMGAAAADFDNDGATDLYVTGVNRNFLYRNERDRTFSDVTERAGVSGLGPGGKKLWSVGAAWLDYDNDSDLDLFVANYLDWSPENNRVCGASGKRLNCSPTDYEGLPNFLYRNDGGGRFTDVSGPTGIGAHIGKGMSVAVADADSDGQGPTLNLRLGIDIEEREDGRKDVDHAHLRLDAHGAQLAEGSGHHERQAQSVVVHEVSVGPFAVAAQGLSVIAQDDDDRLLVQPIGVEPGNETSHLRVDKGDLAVIETGRTSPAVLRQEGLRRLVGRVRVVEVDPDKEGILLLSLEPGQSGVHDLVGWPLDAGEVEMLVLLEIELVVVHVEALVETPSPVEDEGADEGSGLVALRREDLGKRSLRLAEGRAAVDADPVAGRIRTR